VRMLLSDLELVDARACLIRRRVLHGQPGAACRPARCPRALRGRSRYVRGRRRRRRRALSSARRGDDGATAIQVLRWSNRSSK
jgi:hypothetical protein